MYFKLLKSQLDTGVDRVGYKRDIGAETPFLVSSYFYGFNYPNLIIL